MAREKRIPTYYHPSSTASKLYNREVVDGQLNERICSKPTAHLGDKYRRTWSQPLTVAMVNETPVLAEGADYLKGMILRR